MTMHMYYWEDPGNCGYDYVALADCQENARSKAVSIYDGPPELKSRVIEGLQSPATGIFHYNSAIEIFTEGDPEKSLACQQEWTTMRERLRIAESLLSAILKHNGRLEREANASFLSLESENSIRKFLQLLPRSAAPCL